MRKVGLPYQQLHVQADGQPVQSSSAVEEQPKYCTPENTRQLVSPGQPVACRLFAKPSDVLGLNSTQPISRELLLEEVLTRLDKEPDNSMLLLVADELAKPQLNSEELEAFAELVFPYSITDIDEEPMKAAFAEHPPLYQNELFEFKVIADVQRSSTERELIVQFNKKYLNERRTGYIRLPLDGDATKAEVYFDGKRARLPQQGYHYVLFDYLANFGDQKAREAVQKFWPQYITSCKKSFGEEDKNVKFRLRQKNENSFSKNTVRNIISDIFPEDVRQYLQSFNYDTSKLPWNIHIQTFPNHLTASDQITAIREHFDYAFDKIKNSPILQFIFATQKIRFVVVDTLQNVSKLKRMFKPGVADTDKQISAEVFLFNDENIIVFTNDQLLRDPTFYRTIIHELKHLVDDAIPSEDGRFLDPIVHPLARMLNEWNYRNSQRWSLRTDETSPVPLMRIFDGLPKEEMPGMYMMNDPLEFIAESFSAYYLHRYKADSINCTDGWFVTPDSLFISKPGKLLYAVIRQFEYIIETQVLPQYAESSEEEKERLKYLPYQAFFSLSVLHTKKWLEQRNYTFTDEELDNFAASEWKKM